ERPDRDGGRRPHGGEGAGGGGERRAPIRPRGGGTDRPDAAASRWAVRAGAPAPRRAADGGGGLLRAGPLRRASAGDPAGGDPRASRGGRIRRSWTASSAKPSA